MAVAFHVPVVTVPRVVMLLDPAVGLFQAGWMVSIASGVGFRGVGVGRGYGGGEGGEAVGEAVGETVGVTEGDAVGRGVVVGDGEVDGEAVLLGEGVGDGEVEGAAPDPGQVCESLIPESVTLIIA
mgnify:CR=1 FL=1